MTERFFRIDEPLIDAVQAWSRHRIVDGQDPMHGARPVAEIEAAMGPSITPEGIGGPEALRRFTDVVVPATRAMGHRMNLAYVPSAPTSAALVIDLAVSAAEIFGGMWESGAGAIHAENEALAWLVELAGFPPTAGGTFAQGATVGNLSALVAARDAADRRRSRPHRWTVAMTGDAHSSVHGAARVMDVDIVEVPADERGRMTGSALRAALDADPAATAGLFAVVATAGTTNAGMIDEIDAIADVCAEHEVWLHVDGAYGLAALAAPSVRVRLAGVERADSFVVDPHKWLFAPYDACALVYREPAAAALAHSQHATYLEQIERTEWNPGDYAIQLSRRVRGLPFWFSLATYGTDRYSEALERVLATTAEIVAGIESAPHLELVVEPDLSVVLFRRPGWSEEQMLDWSNEQGRAGRILSIPTRWHGELVFRVCIVSPDTRADEVLAALDTTARS